MTAIDAVFAACAVIIGLVCVAIGFCILLGFH